MMLSEEQQKLLDYLDELPARDRDAAQCLLEEDAGMRGGVLYLVEDLVGLVRETRRTASQTMKGEPT